MALLTLLLLGCNVVVPIFPLVYCTWHKRSLGMGSKRCVMEAQVRHYQIYTHGKLDKDSMGLDAAAVGAVVGDGAERM